MEIVFKRESYLGDAVSFVVVSGLIIFSYYYLSPYLSNSFALMVSLHVGIWLLLCIIVLSGYNRSIIISDESIAEKHRIGGGGWSYSWSEIDEWNATIEGEDGDREIKFTAGGNTHALPLDIIDTPFYRQEIKSFFLRHCGKPTQVDSWLIANDTEDG